MPSRTFATSCMRGTRRSAETISVRWPVRASALPSRQATVVLPSAWTAPVISSVRPPAGALDLDRRAQRLVGLGLDLAHERGAAAALAHVRDAGEHAHVQQAAELARAADARRQLVAAECDQDREEERAEDGDDRVAQRARRAGRLGRVGRATTICRSEPALFSATRQLADALAQRGRLGVRGARAVDPVELRLQAQAGALEVVALELRALLEEGARDDVGDVGRLLRSRRRSR